MHFPQIGVGWGYGSIQVTASVWQASIVQLNCPIQLHVLFVSLYYIMKVFFLFFFITYYIIKVFVNMYTDTFMNNKTLDMFSALSCLVAASYTEDKYGVVQMSMSNIITAILTLQEVNIVIELCRCCQQLFLALQNFF